MKAFSFRSGLVMLVCAFMSSVVATSHGAVLVEQDFDDQLDGAIPTGWTTVGGTWGVDHSSEVSNDKSVSNPNSFLIDNNNVGPFSGHRVRRAFTPVSLPNAGPDGVSLLYQFDFNVNPLSDGSVGFQFQIWNGVGGLNGSAEVLRIFSHSATAFTLQGGGFTHAGIGNYGDWYRLHVEFLPTSPSTGNIVYSLNGALLHQAVWSETVPNLFRINNIQFFDVVLIKTNTAVPARMYIDNFLIAIPEPASASLLAVGAMFLAHRRRIIH